MKIKSLMFLIMCLLSGGVSAAGYDAVDLQNLFTDKKQRAQIDAARAGHYSKPSIKKTKKTKKVKMSGYVTRSRGKSVVWLNNKNTLESANVDNVKVQQSNIGKNKKVGVTAAGSHVHLKPGQTWSKGSGIKDITK